MGAIWTALLALSVAFAAAKGRMPELTAAAMTSAGEAVSIAIKLVGVMALWLGLMRVAEEAGLVALLARAMRPVLRRLFPSVPADHPALGAIVMNVSANVLGLGNAATPFGLEAIRRLDDLNPHKGTATDAQAMLCALNTASIQLIPASVIALRVAAGSKAPTEIIGATILASACGLVAAVVAARLLGRFFPAPPSSDGAPR
jgi:spore maturation protein A